MDKELYCPIFQGNITEYDCNETVYAAKTERFPYQNRLKKTYSFLIPM